MSITSVGESLTLHICCNGIVLIRAIWLSVKMWGVFFLKVLHSDLLKKPHSNETKPEPCVVRVGICRIADLLYPSYS